MAAGEKLFMFETALRSYALRSAAAAKLVCTKSVVKSEPLR